jgi:uncharacterized protein YkvS
MNKKFNIGDKVRVTDNVTSDFYKLGATGTVKLELDNYYAVEFETGMFETSKCGNHTWVATADSLELVEKDTEELEPFFPKILMSYADVIKALEQLEDKDRLRAVVRTNNHDSVIINLCLLPGKYKDVNSNMRDLIYEDDE